MNHSIRISQADAALASKHRVSYVVDESSVVTASPLLSVATEYGQWIAHASGQCWRNQLARAN
ncbi:MAG TPA: hypothetical protein VFB14_21825 [Bryobacteraceae bacterium]|nr:hypothetical protein [Bryobacteraceae bacterium]